MSDYEKECIAARKTKNSRNHFVVITGAKVWDEKNILPKVHIDYIMYLGSPPKTTGIKKRRNFTASPSLYANTTKYYMHQLNYMLCKVKYLFHQVAISMNMKNTI